MTSPYTDDTRLQNPIIGGGMDTQHWAGVIVIGSLAFLYLVRRGFRGLSVGGLSVGVR
jgi:uncharacterized phage infection (PIP) family protein YhgE